MDTGRWHEVDRLFEEALERPPAEQPAFLDAECAGDDALRREVERLLAADAQGSDFLASPPDELLRLVLDGPEDGGTLGPYRLLRKIGSGGMGTVYLAHREDEHYERDVAIKVLRSGLATTEAFHRFIAERQILARLEHPNIARLYDGGSTEDGRPYLVMELVEGLPVDEYCDHHRLTVDQRLTLFLKICSAVQYAHQNLLVHRDLKPANILITPEGEPKLLDFGIAKRLAPEADETLQKTQIGLRLLTPRYASPEQALGEAISTASDVYSLGVTLYELLAGRSPYQVSAERPFEIERVLCEQEPERPSAAVFRPGSPSAEEIALARKTRPSALASLLRGDLDNIVLMALRKEPQRRYGSAAELSRDLEKHLQDLPITARADTLSYRTRKFARRHRAGLAVAAAVILLVAGSVVSLVAQGRQLAQERDKARYALTFLVDTFKQADPYQTQGERVTAREILDQGTARISRELSGKPDVQAAVMDAIGEVNLGLGRFAEAEPLLTRALALRRQLFGSGSLEVAESLEHLAAYQSRRSSLDRAEACLREALAIRRRQGNGDLAVARSLNRLGDLLVQQGATPEDVSEIEALFQEALAIARREEGPEGLTVAETLIKLGDFRSEQGDYTEAERLYREGLAIERKALGDRDPRLYRDQSSFGVILVWAGKYREAEALLQGCLETQRELLGRAHPDVAETMHNLAMALHYPGRHREAEAISREVLAMVRSYYGPAHWRVANALHNLGNNLAGQKRYAEAIDLYNQSLEVRHQSGGEKDTLHGRTLLVIAELYREQKMYAQALDFGHRALENFQKTRGPDHTDVAWPLYEIGRSYLDQSRFQEAEPYLRRSLEIRLRRLEPDHIDVSKVQYLLAKCLLRQGRSAEAKPLLQKARTTIVSFYGPDHRIVQSVDRLLAEIESPRHKPQQRSG